MEIIRYSNLHDANMSRVQRWHPGFPNNERPETEWSVAEWTNATAGEVGEACNVAKKIRRLDTGKRGRDTETNRADLLLRLGEEVADTIIYADLVLAKIGLTFGPTISRKFNKTSEEMGFPERLWIP